jgi:outer membrane protein OmpA-like peptidoglycan-associated protein
VAGCDLDRDFASKNCVASAIHLTHAALPVTQFALDGRELFDKPDTAKLGKDKTLNQAGAFLESNPFGLAVLVAETGATGEKESNLKLAQARAMIVRQYLAQKFKVDDARIKTLGIGESQQVSTSGGVKIVVYPGGRDNRALVAKNKK